MRITPQAADTVGNIVSHNDAVSRTPVRAFVALVLAFWVLVVTAEWALPGTEIAPAHSHTDSAVVAEHPHMSDGSDPLAPDTFSEAVLPRVHTALIALGLIAALAAMVPLWGQTKLPVIRGPPRPISWSLSGRVMLTRLCIARR
jgi:hypothetical protein